MKNILKKRIAYEPFEYPEFETFTEMINATFWVHKEVDFIRDVQEFDVNLSETEKYIVETILKSFAQTELHVADDFWKLLGDHIPKPEVMEMCATFTENEYRHAKAYARLNKKLDILNFEEFLDDKIIMGRFDNLLSGSKLKENNVSKEELVKSIAMFSGFTENVNLFSQFAILLSFSQRGILNDIGNIIAWSQKDESIHAKAGMMLANVIMDENPELRTVELEEHMHEAAKRTYEIECELLKDIFKKGELEIVTMDMLKSFMKDRINLSLTTMKFSEVYILDEKDRKNLDSMSWFYDEANAMEQTDFFHSRPVEYSKNVQNYSKDNLF